MRSHPRSSRRLSALASLAALLALAGCGPGKSARPTATSSKVRVARLTAGATSPVNLTAQRTTTTLRDGSTAPMWAFCESSACAAATAWAPGPTIVAAAGTSLTVNLTNNLPVPTSLVILGQLGGGLGTPTTMPSPAHSGQTFTTFPGNGSASPAFTPPAQGNRVRTFGAEVAAGQTQALTWSSLKPGTYVYETGTLPSLQVPMGLYGVLVVTTAPAAGVPGVAYPGVQYDDDVALLFSELDPAQNAAVDAAAAVGTDVKLRFNDPTCNVDGASVPRCYPAAVNYAPTYFFINGQAFDRTAPESSAFDVGDAATYSTGKVLVRLLNAGSRTHVPAIVGLPMALVAEDGNLAPGNPKVQNEVLLTAGKTFDALVAPAGAAATGYASATYPVFDRSLFLSTDNHPDGGMQGFLLVNHAAAVAAGAGVCSGTTTVCSAASPCGSGTCVAAGAAGNLPAALTVAANDDTFKVPFNTTIAGDVTANDVGVARVALGATNVSHGTLTLNPDGTFRYTPSAGFSGTDTFTYVGNGTVTATVSLVVAAQLTGAGNRPVANADTFVSNVATRFSAPRPGVLANDTDPNGFPLTAGAVTGSTCATVNLDPDGSFDVTTTATAPSSCSFSYTATNSQGTSSAAALVTVSFGPSTGKTGLAVAIVDAATGAAVTDYRWILQEDLTFKHDTTGTPSLATRTVGTSFHRSHMTVVASGCVGAVSCGSGQSVRGAAVTDAQALALQTTPDQAILDPTKNYYLSILPGDGSPPAHTMGGAEIRAGRNLATPLTIRLQGTPLPTAQMSIYIYEDNSPTNGQDDIGETPLGGFNIILLDPAGRTGDPAGQQTYDAFNMPLSNSLLGRPGCPDTLNAGTNGTGTSAGGNVVGAVYTCPNDPNAGTPAADPARYALAGHALIQNLTPARYDVLAHPGAAREGAGEVWWQTETLEGTQAQDGFVGVGEPVYFQEFGPPGPHITIGFVSPGHLASNLVAGGTHTINGKITNQHMSRPADVTLWDSGSYDLFSSTTCRVVLNAQAGTGPAVAAAECNPDGTFSLTGIPPGDYDLAVFDQWLDQIIQNVAVSITRTDPAVKDMGNIPVLSWFTQYDQNIFQDLNGNGVYDAGEPGISNVPLTVRFRNGAPSNSTLSDSNGNGILVELFPLFNWYVAEADTTRFKQTGVSVEVDGGGRPDASGPGAGIWTSTYATGESSLRTEQPGALSYGLQGFISERSRVDWGRAPYAAGENGGIVGTVVYSSTRPFDDMRYNVQTIWEPLVPRVTVNLYREDTLADGTKTLTQVDTTQTSSFDDFVNLVYGADGGRYLLGSDNQLRDPATGALAAAAAYPPGKQVNLQCPGQVPSDPFVNYTLGANDVGRCYDGWHSWNQLQAAPYDGRYVFPSAAYVAAHPLCSGTVTGNCTAAAPGQTLASLPPGNYVVEEVTPPGYEVVKEEDKNILIGDTFTGPAPLQFGPLASIFILPDQATLGNANPNNPNTGDPGFQSDPTTNLGAYSVTNGAAFPECVGNLHRVPDYLSLFPQAAQVAPFAGMDRPLCDRKRVVLNDQMQGSAYFFVFTEVPSAAVATGIILDDATSEFNAYAPDFGEKASVPFVPVSVKDYTGAEISRTYADQWGAYNMLAPSSWLVNPPTPSGYGPNMLVTCINDPGPVPDPVSGQLVTDPQYNPAYSNFCYTNPFMPGQTTYLDTPVLPVAAFASGYNQADCQPQDQAPAILRVDAATAFGPYLPAAGGALTITALGDQVMPNPAYAGPFATSGLAAQRTITRHYGFGSTAGHVLIGGVDLTSRVTSWGDAAITLDVPAGTPTGELTVTTATGQSTVDAVTVTLEDRVPTRVTGGGSIQAAVDLANPGDLILVDAGTYNELVIMYKPVRLQGVGAAAVIVNAAKYPTSKLAAWRPRVNALFAVDPTTGNQTGPSQVDPLPGQEITGGVVILEPTVLGSEEGAGITVLAKNLPASACGDQTQVGWDSNFSCVASSRIDGLSVTGGDAGGGIYVNGWAHNLEIANNHVYGNAGAYSGGIRVGVPDLEGQTLPLATGTGRIPGLGYDKNVWIHHNAVTKNGSLEAPVGSGGAGGGLAICSGTDNYRVDHNLVCGNFGAENGGGVGHLGFSQGGTIAFNQILFNQSFQQTNSTHGGGIFVGGETPTLGGLTNGTGDLTVDANLIRGNVAEGGQGGGIRLQLVNGADVAASSSPAQWHHVTITNNMIVDNVAGWAGAGVSMADTVNAVVINNTIANNDSVGIAGVVLAGGVALPGAASGTAGVGHPTPSGLVTETTSAGLLAAIPAVLRAANAVSNPVLENDILWQNRSFYYSGDGRLCVGNSAANVAAGCATLPNQSASGQCVAGAKYWDIGVLTDPSTAPTANHLNPTYSVMTSATGYAGAGLRTGDPLLVNPYCNGARTVPELVQVINPPAVPNLQVAATVDEGNNYVNLRYGPLYTVNPVTGVAFGDYHLGGATPSGSSSSAFNAGTATGAPSHDFDAQPRPMGGAFDVGADEFLVASPVLTVTPSPVSFGVVSVNTSRTVAVTVSNGASATANLVLAATTITAGVGGSSQPARYSQTSTCPTGGAGLAPGASCAIAVTFAPTGVTIPTLQTATLHVNATNAPAATVALSGTGVVPVYTVTPGSFAGHNFGNQAVGSTSAPFQFTITNAGSFPVTGGELWLTGNPTLTGASANQFAAAYGGTNPCAVTTHLTTGASCTLTVAFAPTSAGAKGTGILNPGARVDVPHVAGAVNGGLVGSPVWGTGVVVSGTVTFSAATLGALTGTAATRTLAFGNLSGSQTSTVTVTVGAAPVTFGTATVTNGTGAAFTKGADGCSGSTVAAGGTCAIQVQFVAPAGNSARTGTLSVPDNGAGTPQTLRLTGR
jgi:hypothetical protein